MPYLNAIPKKCACSDRPGARIASRLYAYGTTWYCSICNQIWELKCDSCKGGEPFWDEAGKRVEKA